MFGYFHNHNWFEGAEQQAGEVVYNCVHAIISSFEHYLDCILCKRFICEIV